MNNPILSQEQLEKIMELAELLQKQPGAQAHNYTAAAWLTYLAGVVSGFQFRISNLEEKCKTLEERLGWRQ